MNRIISVETEGPYLRYLYSDGHQKIIEKWPELKPASRWGDYVFWTACALATLFTLWVTVYWGKS